MIKARKSSTCCCDEKFLLRFVLIVGLGAMALCLSSPAFAATHRQQNLLNNPGFDGAYNADGSANGWTAWWREPDSTYRKPEFRDAFSSGGRVHSGNNAQKYSTTSAVHQAGVYQQVTGVIIGQEYRFTALCPARLQRVKPQWRCKSALIQTAERIHSERV